MTNASDCDSINRKARQTSEPRYKEAYLLYLLEHPEVAEQIPENALVVLLPAEDQELCERNLDLAKARQESGQAVVHVWIDKVAPPRSRLVKPRVEVAA